MEKGEKEKGKARRVRRTFFSRAQADKKKVRSALGRSFELGSILTFVSNDNLNVGDVFEESGGSFAEDLRRGRRRKGQLEEENLELEMSVDSPQGCRGSQEAPCSHGPSSELFRQRAKTIMSSLFRREERRESRAHHLHIFCQSPNRALPSRMLQSLPKV